MSGHIWKHLAMKELEMFGNLWVFMELNGNGWKWMEMDGNGLKRMLMDNMAGYG